MAAKVARGGGEKALKAIMMSAMLGGGIEEAVT